MQRLSGYSTLTSSRKANVSSGQSELEELEARLRATEQRLAKVSRQNSPSREAQAGADTAASNEPAQQYTSPLAHRPMYPDDRPPTAPRPQTGRENTQEKMSKMPGAMPETPREVSSRDDYVMVESRNER